MRNAGRGRRNGGAPPPVLCYHRVGGAIELGVTRVPESVFARQMTALARAGFQALSLQEYSQRLAPDSSACRVPPSAFLLTFDDGYTELAEHAYPLLADLGFTATTFVVTDFIGRDNTWDVRYTWRRLRHLAWDAIERWQARGFTFASHGATHARLTWLSDAAVTQELGGSRETLKSRLGADAARAVAYPFGAVDARIVRLARAAGYELGFGRVWGGGGEARDHGHPFQLPRVPAYMWDVWDVPFGLRNDTLGALGRFVAGVANRCSVATSVLKRLGRA